MERVQTFGASMCAYIPGTPVPFLVQFANDYVGSLVSKRNCRVLRPDPRGVFIIGIIRRAMGPRKAFHKVFNIILEGVLFPIRLPACEFWDDVGFFNQIHHRSFDSSLPILAYRRWVEVAWKDVFCVRWLRS